MGRKEQRSCWGWSRVLVPMQPCRGAAKSQVLARTAKVKRLYFSLSSMGINRLALEGQRRAQSGTSTAAKSRLILLPVCQFLGWWVRGGRGKSQLLWGWNKTLGAQRSQDFSPTSDHPGEEFQEVTFLLCYPSPGETQRQTRAQLVLGGSTDMSEKASDGWRGRSRRKYIQIALTQFNLTKSRSRQGSRGRCPQ